MIPPGNRPHVQQLVKRAAKRISPADQDAIRMAILADRFDKQRAFIFDKSRKKAAFCSRRAGKTENTPNDLYDGAIQTPGSLQIYCAIARTRAKELLWEPLKATASKLNLDFKPNESELSIRVASGQGSYIRLTGADKINEAQKRRGDKTRRVRIDEAQLFPFHILQTLVKDVFGPTLEDLGGDLGLLGTPGEACAGYWYGVTRPEKEKRTPGWAVHEWNVLDNPHVPLIHERMRNGELAAECGGEDSPTFQREWLGRWVRDTGSLFYAYDEDRNSHGLSPAELVGPDWFHVIGWDLGADDAMALTVWAFSPQKTRDVFEAFSWKESHCSTDKVMDIVKELKKTHNFVGKVGDSGGLGKLIIEEVDRRRSENFEAAQKSQKAAHVKLFNDELRASRIKLMRNSPLAEEMALLPKVANWVPEEHDGRPAPEDPRFANHCCDAGLYAWRFAWSYLHQAALPEPEVGSAEAARLEAERLKQARVVRLQQRRQREWYEQ